MIFSWHLRLMDTSVDQGKLFCLKRVLATRFLQEFSG